MESLPLFISLALLVYALGMTLVYLVFEKGGILDPIPVSWAGYIVFIVLAMLSLAGMSKSIYVSQETRTFGCTLVVVATFVYTLGLYTGKGILIADMLPKPAVNFTKGAIWIVWIVSILALLLASFLSPYLGASMRRVLNGLALGFLGSATLISLFALLSLRKSPFTKVVMVVSSSASAILLFQYMFSRRPLIGLVIAILGFFYIRRISARGWVTKSAFISVSLIAVLLITLYLSATRGKRFYGDAVIESVSPFSVEALTELIPAVRVNYLAYEFTLEQFPQHNNFLYGSGLTPAFLFFIPRSLWPAKPVASGYFISQLWYGRPDPPSNLSPLPLGELYMNFGIFGLILGTFLAGKAVRIINSYLRMHTNSPILWLAWLIIVPDFASEWRGDFTSMSVQAFLRVAVFLGIGWFAARLSLSGSRDLPRIYFDVIPHKYMIDRAKRHDGQLGG